MNVSTVSRALNNNNKIAPETRDAILNRARELGWKPNPFASVYMSHLRSTREPSHQGNLAFLIPFKGLYKSSAELPEYRKLVFAGAKARAESQGFFLEPIWLREINFDMQRLTKLLKNRGVMGVIIEGGNLKDENFHGFDWSAFAVATWGFSLRQPRIHRAALHMAFGMRLALSRIRALGYSRISLALSKYHDELVDYAARSYFYDEQTMAVATSLIKIYDGFTLEDRRDVERWIRKTKPEVIVGDALVWQAVKAMKLKVPEDVAFVSPHWSGEWPEIAGIDHLPFVIGTNVLDLVTGQIIRNERGIPPIPKLLFHEGVWRDGASLPPKGGDFAQVSGAEQGALLPAGPGAG